MTGFELGTSAIGNDRAVDFATTTARIIRSILAYELTAATACQSIWCKLNRLQTINSKSNLSNFRHRCRFRRLRAGVDLSEVV